MAEVVRALGALIRWGWVACDERQKEEGYKIWCNAYWKTELGEIKLGKEINSKPRHSPWRRFLAYCLFPYPEFLRPLFRSIIPIAVFLVSVQYHLLHI